MLDQNDWFEKVPVKMLKEIFSSIGYKSLEESILLKEHHMFEKTHTIDFVSRLAKGV